MAVYGFEGQEGDYGCRAHWNVLATAKYYVDHGAQERAVQSVL